MGWLLVLPPGSSGADLKTGGDLLEHKGTRGENG